MTFRRARVALVLAAAVTVTLAGCAPATSTPTTSPGSTGAPPSATPTATPAIDVTAPAAQIATPCSALLTAQQVSNWQGAGTSFEPPATVAGGDLADSTLRIPVADYVRAAGGLDCVWSAGPVDHYGTEGTTVPSYLEVTLQFGAAAEYNENASSMGAVNGRAGECDVDDPGSIQLDDLVGNTWVEIFSRHATGTANGSKGIEPVETAVLAALNAAGAPSGVPQPQAGTTTLGTQCTDFASVTDVQTAVGAAAALTAITPNQAQSFGSALETPLWIPSQDALKNHPCDFKSGSKTQAVISWIPGGAWAWNENKTQTLAEAPLQNLALTGEGANDSASLRCAASGVSCTVDLVLGGNWIEVTVPASSTATNRSDAVTQIAQAVVNTVG